MSKFEVGQLWRAKKPRAVGYWPGEVNDRLIKWISADGQTICYDGPAVADGFHYPRVSVEAFEKWAGQQLKDSDLPPDRWESWPMFVTKREARK